MTEATIFPTLEIPETLAAGPGPGNTDRRVLTRFAAAGVADHMQADVLRGMVEAKLMLREVWGTDNVHTFGVAGTGWSGLDAMMSAVAAGDSVVAFANGICGDVDDDGVVTILDGLHTASASVGIGSLDPAQSIRADTNGDTLVTITDALIIAASSAPVRP